MTTNDILKQRNRIISNIKQHRLRDAFKELKSLSEGAMTWEIGDEIVRIEDAYKLMLQYATQGADDPARNSLYENIVTDLYTLIDRVVRQKLITEEPTLYYNTLRYEQLQQAESITNLLNNYITAIDKSSLYNLISSENNDKKDYAKEKEQLEHRIFNRIWVTFPIKNDDEEAIQHAITSDSIPSYFKQLLVSALLIGLFEFFDEKRLLLLFTAYQSTEQEVSAKALIAILLTMHIYNNHINTPKLLNHFNSIKELPTWTSDVKTAYIEMVRTRDTERISRKMQNELIPEMLKLRPDLYKKLNDSTAMIDMSSIEENPEWEEMLKNSGITDKIKELNKLQEDGSDVFMSTFSHLKSFPFFSEITNWFMPFSLENRLVCDTLGSDLAIVGNIIDSAPYLCDSDKYSFLLSLGSIPQQQRQMMLSQFEQQREALNEAGITLASTTRPGQRKNVINKYIQDLYRFFKLFRRKGEFNDPFKKPINLVNIPLITADIDDEETLTIVAEFYFQRKYFEDALNVFLSILEKTPAEPQYLQKTGYCYHQLGDIENALKYYEQAELLNADSLWTLRRIGACYRQLNQPEKALKYYERIESTNPDDLNTAMNIGHCHLEMGNYQEAIKFYYKVEFLDEKSTKAWRPLAWSFLLSCDYIQSNKYYEKILADNPSHEDFLNMGHLALAQGKFTDAIAWYKKSINNNDDNIDAFIESLHNDEKYLKAINIDISIMPFIIDSILYSFD